MKYANSRFLKQYHVPWHIVFNCEFPTWFNVMPLKYLCNIKTSYYIENKFRCYFRLLFVQYNVTMQYQSLVNLLLSYQYTSQGKMGTVGLDESHWILNWVSNFLYHDGTKAHPDSNSINVVLFLLGVKQPHFIHGCSLSSSIKLKNIWGLPLWPFCAFWCGVLL